jgi:hypothetical protein
LEIQGHSQAGIVPQKLATGKRGTGDPEPFSLGCVLPEILAVLEPQIGLGALTPNPYWMNIASIRDVLDHSSASGPGRKQILDVCCDMMVPSYEDRNSAAALLRQMSYYGTLGRTRYSSAFVTDALQE